MAKKGGGKGLSAEILAKLQGGNAASAAAAAKKLKKKVLF